MATLSNKLTITDFGLNRISEEILTERIFDSSKLTISGNPIIEGNGILSALSEYRGAFYSNLSFEDTDTIRIMFEGNIGGLSTPEFYQCLWHLDGGEDRYIELNINESAQGNQQLELVSKTPGTDNVIFNYPINVSLDSRISVSVELTRDTYVINLLSGKITASFEGSITPSITFSYFSKIIIGNDKIYPVTDLNPATHNFWRGSVILSRFTISKNGSLYYAPSNDVSFIFSKVVVGDGSFPLNDNSYPVSRKVYVLPIEEMARTGNNILFKVYIDKEVTLTIKELGLYINVEGNSKLFAITRDLNIRKGKDVGYELIFHVNIDLTVLNIDAFPDIKITNVDNVSKSDFILIKEVTLGTVGDMEVASGKNATELGYNKPQAFYRLSDKINLYKENWLASEDYTRLSTRVIKKVVVEFNPDSVEKHGSIHVTRDGIASGFTPNSYVTIRG